MIKKPGSLLWKYKHNDKTTWKYKDFFIKYDKESKDEKYIEAVVWISNPDFAYAHIDPSYGKDENYYAPKGNH